MLPSVTVQDAIKILGNAPIVLGQHYFIPNNPAPLPKFDFTSDAEKGNAAAFVVATGVGSLPSPAGNSNVPWLELKNVQGQLANSVFRVETAGGQPPTSCIAGALPLSVKYTAQYCESRHRVCAVIYALHFRVFWWIDQFYKVFC